MCTSRASLATSKANITSTHLQALFSPCMKLWNPGHGVRVVLDVAHIDENPSISVVDTLLAIYIS